jgi:DUF971 family protein
MTTMDEMPHARPAAGIACEGSPAAAVPTGIARLTDPGNAGGIEITWSDGARLVYTPRLLRDACPCATCREKRAAPAGGPNPLQVLSAAEVAPLAVAGMKPVGQYAYSIEFSDGHATGIYTLEYLRELGTPPRGSGTP